MKAIFIDAIKIRVLLLLEMSDRRVNSIWSDMYKKYIRNEWTALVLRAIQVLLDKLPHVKATLTIPLFEAVRRECLCNHPQIRMPPS